MSDILSEPRTATDDVIRVGSVEIRVGDVFARLAEMPDDSIDCVVTSPPYWGLRDYGVDGQIGLEPTLAEHIACMVALFAEVRRVLKPGGTLWLNYGDCYATTPNGRSAADQNAAGTDDRTFRDKPFSTVGPIYQPSAESGDRRGVSGNKGSAGQSDHRGRVASGGYLKPKDLCMLPNRLAIALQDDGWWVRSEIIWGKPNAMPDSSGRYRPAVAHEKIFLLTKSDKPCFWVARDTGHISQTPDLTERCALITDTEREGSRWIGLGHYYNARAVHQGGSGGAKPRATKMPDGWDTGAGGHGSFHREGREKGKTVSPGAGDKQRGHSRPHAGFDDRCDAVTKAEQGLNGRLLRNYEPPGVQVWHMATAAFSGAHFATFPPELVERCIAGGCPPGGTVLDIFGGSGTTGLVAKAMSRPCILIELNPEYAALAADRLRIGAVKTKPAKPGLPDLFDNEVA